MKKLLFVVVCMMAVPLSWAQDTVYECDFDQPWDTAGWMFAGEYQSHFWAIGTPSNMSSGGLFVTCNGTDNTYYLYGGRSVSYAYRRIVLPRGVFRFSYDWRCNGWRNDYGAYDYMRVLLVRGAVSPIEGRVPTGMGTVSSNNLPEGYTALDGSVPLCGSTTWVSHSSDCFVEDSGMYTLVFMWYSIVVQYDPPAAVDNLVVARPQCPQPGLPYVSPLTSTAFTARWRDFSEGNTDNWQVELCTASQTIGQGVRRLVQDTSAVFTGLTPNSDYMVYISALCGSDTTAPVGLHVHTPCAGLVSLPDTQTFATTSVGSLPSCWRMLKTGGNAMAYSYGDGQVLQWQMAQSGYCCVVLPNVDEDATPSGNLQVSFSVCREHSLLPYSHTFEIGLLPSPGYIGSFIPISQVVVNSDQWERCVVEFDGYSGGNIAILDMGNPFVIGYALFDDFVISRAVACQPVDHLTVSRTTATGTMVEWEPCRGTVHPPIGYEVWLELADLSAEMPSEPDTAWLQYYSTEPRCTVSGLLPDTTYRAWVRAQCDGGAYSQWECVAFATMPPPCAVGDTATADTALLGTGTSHVTGVPVSNVYANSFCQSIYTAEELRDSTGMSSGLITGIDYTFTNNPRDMMVSIYLSTTTDSLYASTHDMIPVHEGNIVYGPALLAAHTDGTVHYQLDPPFSWNGADNLVITSIINNAAGAIQSSSFHGNSTPAVGNRTIHSYLNDQPFTPAGAALVPASLSNYRPSVALHIMECAEAATCAAPVVAVRDVGEDNATIEWTPGYGESEWSLYYRRWGDSLWTLASSRQTATHCLLPLLQASTSYEVSVVAHCQDDSLCGFAAFTTTCASIYDLPFVEDFEDFRTSRTNNEVFEPCWYHGIKTPSHEQGCNPFVVTNSAYSGTHSLRFFTSENGWPAYIATPAMAMSVTDLQVNFYTNGPVYYPLKVGVMTDPTDYSTFELVEQVTPNQTGVWEAHEVSLAGYQGEGRHIALMLSESVVNIDSFSVDYIQLCPRPTHISFGIITRTTAEVQWDGGEARHYQLEYGPTGFALGTGIRLACNADTVTLRGLNHSTDYDIYVRGFCSEDTSRWSFVTTFSTQCGEIESLPYTQNFENLDGYPYPKCWVCGNASVVNYLPMGGQQQERALYLRGAYAILPAVDSSLSAIQQLQLVVKASSDTNYGEVYSHDLIVGVCSTEGDITTFNPLDTITLTPVSTVYEVPLTAAAGVGRYLTLISTPTGRALNNRVYIDSLIIESIPTCVRPRRLTVANLTTTSATITWSGGTGATAWQVEYMPHGDAIGTGVSQTVSTNSLVINGLTPATSYDYYVRSICGVGDTSEWCYTPGLIVTPQIPASVPYAFGFDTVAEWNNWQTLSNCAAAWCRGMDDGQPAPSIYLSIDSGATRGILANTAINTAVYRDFDFGNRDTSYVISFDASLEGSAMTSQNYDGLAVFLVEPSTVPNIPSSYANESPWGSLSDLTLLANIHRPREWSDYHITIDSLSGVWRLVFYWYGRSGIYTAPGAIDNVSIQYVDCQHPYNVHTTGVTAVSANLGWHGPANADYRVLLYNSDRTLLAVDTVHGNSIHYEDLVPGTIYKVRVGRLCDGTLGLQTPRYTFATNACSGGTNDTILSTATTGTTYSLPVNNCYRNSYTQQIILASELGGTGDISSIGFLYESPYRMTAKTNCTIYLGHTTRAYFDHSNDTVPRTEMQVVYMGSINCSQGWNRIILGTPFAYDGTSNLVLAIDDNSNNYHNYHYQFATSPTTNAMSLAHYTSYSVDATTRQLYHYRNLLTIEMCPPNDCSRPRLRTPRVRPNDVTIRWNNTSDRYLVGYRLMGSDSWIVDNLFTTDTFFTITSFYFDSDYVYHVSQYCDSGVSNWSIGTFNTAEIPCLPPLNLRVIQQTNKKAWFAWTPEDNNISYRLHVWGGGGYDTIVTTYLANGMVENLNPASRYYAAVEVRCEYSDQPSIWSDTVSFTTASCPDVVDVRAVEVGGNSVLLDWDSEDGVVRWLLEWGHQGFDHGMGDIVETDHHPYLLTGLTGETTYEITVRALCGDDFVSENWSNRLTVTTAYSGIHSVADDSRVQLQPNPTSGDVQITLPDDAGAVCVEVIDMAGRTRQTYTLPPHTLRATLATSQLPQGAYYVRVTGNRLNTVRKALKTY